MSEIEKMKRYIEKSCVPHNPRYDASFGDMVIIANNMSRIEALEFVFRYGQAKGYRAAKAKMREAITRMN